MLQVRISQPGGLSLALSRTEPSSLDVTVEGGGLSAHSMVTLDADVLCQFFRDAATRTAPVWGRWEYKSATDEDFILHAAPEGPEDIRLWIDLVSPMSEDSADWQVKGTIILPVSRFREHAAEVARVFSRPPEP